MQAFRQVFARAPRLAKVAGASGLVASGVALGAAPAQSQTIAGLLDQIR